MHFPCVFGLPAAASLQEVEHIFPIFFSLIFCKKEFDTEEENTVQIEVLIQEDDMGRVIGKNGKVISGIRTVVQASSSLYDNKKVKINVSSY